ncbi:hypothetical protein P0D71_07175 [Paraburkholderia sp. RL17-383-BIF-A]|uniref:BPSL0761 family protein n=1 Tax=unclassified Paraburkholderia TaxID=2615204 RepID=UPI0038BAAF2C
MNITPEERTRAILDARQLLQTLAAGDEITVVNLLRSVAVGVLQHYPLDVDLELSAVALPEIWGALKSKQI